MKSTFVTKTKMDKVIFGRTVTIKEGTAVVYRDGVYAIARPRDVCPLVPDGKGNLEYCHAWMHDATFRHACVDKDDVVVAPDSPYYIEPSLARDIRELAPVGSLLKVIHTTDLSGTGLTFGKDVEVIGYCFDGTWNPDASIGGRGIVVREFERDKFVPLENVMGHAGHNINDILKVHGTSVTGRLYIPEAKWEDGSGDYKYAVSHRVAQLYLDIETNVSKMLEGLDAFRHGLSA